MEGKPWVRMPVRTRAPGVISRVSTTASNDRLSKGRKDPWPHCGTVDAVRKTGGSSWLLISASDSWVGQNRIIDASRLILNA